MPQSRLLFLALMLGLIGCDGKKDPAPQPPADPTPAPTADPAPKGDPAPAAPAQAGDPTPAPPQPAAGWTDNLQEMRFPATPAAGRVNGQSFGPQTAEVTRIRGRFLNLRQGEEFNPDFELKILLSGAKDENFSGKTFEVAPGAGPESLAVTLLYKGPDSKPGEPKQFDGKYALRLEFGQESEGQLPGKIYLCLLDEPKSYVAGTFTALVEPDYSKPPRADEAAWVVGRIAFKAREKLNVVTGVIGLTADGTRVTNLTGTDVLPGAETSVSSVDAAPPRSTLVNDAEGGCQCRHTRLAPGRYLVFVGTGDRYIDWRWVEVKEKATLTLDFTLDPKETGALEVALPKNVQDELRLIPLDETGKVPDVKDALNYLSLAMKTDVPAKDGKVVLDGLRPGRYRVAAGAAERDVTVTAKETARVDLSAP